MTDAGDGDLPMRPQKSLYAGDVAIAVDESSVNLTESMP
jgi:hypothetical protein